VISSRESASTPISTTSPRSIYVSSVLKQLAVSLPCLFYTIYCHMQIKKTLRSCISKECVHGELINIHETLLGLSCTTQNALLHFNSRKNHSFFVNTPVLSGRTTCIKTLYFLTISVCGVTFCYTLIYLSRTQ